MIAKRTSRRLCIRLQPVFLLTAFCHGWTIAPSSSHHHRLHHHRPSLLRILSHLGDKEIDTLNILPDNDTPCPRTTSDRRAWMHQCYSTTAAAALSMGLTTAAPALAATTVATTPAVCDATVTVWKRGEQRLLYLLGTAHISEVSAQLAGTLVDDVHPNAVFVELDLKRIQQVTGSSSSGIETQRRVFDSPAAAASTPESSSSSDPESTSSPPPPSTTTTRIIVPVAAEAQTPGDPQQQQQQQQLTSSNKNWFQRRVLNFATRAVGNALRGMYSNLNDAGFQPGEEFAAAMRQGRAVGASIVLGDQDVELTLRRLTEALAQTDLNQLMDPDAGYEKSLVELMPNGALEPEIKNYDDPAQYKAELAAYVEKLKSRESVRKIVVRPLASCSSTALTYTPPSLATGATQ